MYSDCAFATSVMCLLYMDFLRRHAIASSLIEGGPEPEARALCHFCQMGADILKINGGAVYPPEVFFLKITERLEWFTDWLSSVC